MINVVARKWSVWNEDEWLMEVGLLSSTDVSDHSNLFPLSH